MSVTEAPPARPLLEGFTTQRTVGQRLAVHEPIYFIAGTETPEAKFQLSFKYRLATLQGTPERNSSHTLQFAYTQRSLWDTGSKSSPFYDTSYMPELMYQWVATAGERSTAGLSWLALQSGVRHESNGQADAASRSLNNLYLRSAFAMGPSDGWHVLVVPEVYGYIGGLSENPDLPQYRGYFTLRAGVTRADRESLLLTLIPGRDFSRGSRQLDFSIPVRIASIDFGAYLLVQYFDGYGESLLAYTERSSALRIGFALVR
jgi:outer membrane phospholipase A